MVTKKEDKVLERIGVTVADLMASLGFDVTFSDNFDEDEWFVGTYMNLNKSTEGHVLDTLIKLKPVAEIDTTRREEVFITNDLGLALIYTKLQEKADKLPNGDPVVFLRGRNELELICKGVGLSITTHYWSGIDDSEMVLGAAAAE
jgi:hypothetical protein